MWVVQAFVNFGSAGVRFFTMLTLCVLFTFVYIVQIVGAVEVGLLFCA